MADYWKSIEKKYCNFCRTWITNNRPSVEFHERGRRHKRNVEKKLKFLTKQKETEKKIENTNAEILARLEKDAIKAYQKDLINNPDLLKAMITDHVPEVIPEPNSYNEIVNDEQEPSTSTEETVYDPVYIGQLQKAKMSWETVSVTNIEDPVIEDDNVDSDDNDNVEEFQKNSNSTIDYCRKVEEKLESEPEESEQEQFKEKILETNLDDRKESCTFKKRKLAHKNFRKQNVN